VCSGVCARADAAGGFLGSAKSYQPNTVAEKEKSAALCQVYAGPSQEALLCCTTSIRVVAKGSRCFWYKAKSCIWKSPPHPSSIGRRCTRAFKKGCSSVAQIIGGLLLREFQKAIVAAKAARLASPKTRIITALSRMHRPERLVYAKARRDDLTLVRAAEKQFGSWGKALYAAGIDPRLYYIRHRQPKRFPLL
jgi:hypothetical protein